MWTCPFQDCQSKCRIHELVQDCLLVTIYELIKKNLHLGRIKCIQQVFEAIQHERMNPQEKENASSSSQAELSLDQEKLHKEYNEHEKLRQNIRMWAKYEDDSSKKDPRRGKLGPKK